MHTDEPTTNSRWGGDMVVLKYLKFLFLKLAFCGYLEHILGKFNVRKGPWRIDGAPIL